jgi:hypothetical protein
MIFRRKIARHGRMWSQPQMVRIEAAVASSTAEAATRVATP